MEGKRGVSSEAKSTHNLPVLSVQLKEQHPAKQRWRQRDGERQHGSNDDHLPFRAPAFLGHDFQPSDNDVICARGSRAFQHPGNQRFRELIKQNVAEYSSANNNRLQKTRIVTQIVNSVRESSLHGGFVKETEKGQWFEVGLTAAREKVGQGFRDLLHTKYRSSTKAKQRRRLGGKQQDDSNIVKDQRRKQHQRPQPVTPPTKRKEKMTTSTKAAQKYKKGRMVSPTVPAVANQEPQKTTSSQPGLSPKSIPHSAAAAAVASTSELQQEADMMLPILATSSTSSTDSRNSAYVDFAMSGDSHAQQQQQPQPSPSPPPPCKNEKVNSMTRMQVLLEQVNRELGLSPF